MAQLDATDLFASFVLRGEKLPADAHTISYHAREAISEPFHVEIEFYTLDHDFDVLTCLTTSMVLTVINERGQQRFFHGIVRRAQFVRAQDERFFFRVVLEPSLGALGLREDCRIFQDMSVVDITVKLLEEAGLSDTLRWDIVKSYEPKEFIVQYRESALNFLARLFEDFGLFYFFEHGEDKHTLVIADNPEAFSPLDAPRVEFTRMGGLLGIGTPLKQVARTRSLRTNSVNLQDYDFEKPQAKPDASLNHKEGFSLPYYEYPANFIQPEEGKLRAAARLGQLRHDADVCHGDSDAIDLRPGVPFSVEGSAEADLNGEFVLIRLHSQGLQDPSDRDKSFACKNQFWSIPKGAQWMPPMRAKRPRIQGVQTAIVTGQGEADQTIHVDKYARIKVRFYWDRVNQQDDTSSCWIRVSQVPLGGSMILPRVGWEMSVAFLEGNPDRPIVLGRLYNAEHTPPAGLPGAKASGSLKSMSSPGGGGHNLVGADDSGGKQGFNVHAQKDLNISTGNDWTEEIGVDDTHNVTKNLTNEVGADETVQVGGNQTINTGANLSNKIGGGQSISVGGNDDSNATCDHTESIGGSRSYTVSGNQTTICNGVTQNITGSLARTVGSVNVVASVASISDNVLASRTSNVGAVRASLVVGTHGEVVNGMKNQTSAAAELHINRANRVCDCTGPTTIMIGGLHYQKIDGDYTVGAPMITLLGAVADIKGGSGILKLGGGPIVMKGSKVAIKSPMVIKMGTSLKEG